MTLTDIAAGVGMHKSTMLRYFETREEIFLCLASMQWSAWSNEAATALDDFPDDAPPQQIAETLTGTLLSRPLFCELLAHVPLNLERGVSFEAVRTFKLIAIDAFTHVVQALKRFGMSLESAGDVVATATAMTGSLWQMAAPGTELRRFYEQEPSLAHAIVDVEPRLVSILTAMIRGSRT